MDRSRMVGDPIMSQFDRIRQRQWDALVRRLHADWEGAPHPVATNHNGGRGLIVDSRRPYRQQLQYALARANCRVVTCEHYEEAARCMGSERWDFLMVDVELRQATELLSLARDAVWQILLYSNARSIVDPAVSRGRLLLDRELPVEEVVAVLSALRRK